jgi:dihydroxy-acid dehydratase
VLADVRPSGRYLMSELIAIGGIQPLMKILLDAGYLHGECMTVTGETLAENLADVAPYPPGQDIIRPLSAPLKKDSHLVVLYGNLAPDGAVAKITGREGLAFSGPARVFDGEERATAAILAGGVRAGDVVVIRYEGPKGGPGMREMLSPTGALFGRGSETRSLSSRTAASPAAATASWLDILPPRLPSPGRLHSFAPAIASALTPCGAPSRSICYAAELKRRRAAWKPRRPYATAGVLAKYAHLVGSASFGAVTDDFE